MSKGEWKGIERLRLRLRTMSIVSTNPEEIDARVESELRKRLRPLLEAVNEMAILAEPHLSPRIGKRVKKELDTWR